MKFVLKFLIFVSDVGMAGAAGYHPVIDYWESRNQIAWETAVVESGDITRYVNSTGTIKPVLSVSVGTFVSGTIVELNVDFNDEVKEGDLGEVKVHALRSVTRNVELGEYIALIGPSGSGKSTLVNTLGCLDRPAHGSYLLDGEEIVTMNRDDES